MPIKFPARDVILLKIEQLHARIVDQRDEVSLTPPPTLPTMTASLKSVNTADLESIDTSDPESPNAVNPQPGGSLEGAEKVQ